MSAELMLECSTVSILITEERKNNDIVIGVPHHAPAGKKTLPCKEHPKSDENAGFLGRYIAEKLDSHSIVVCNYTMDVNKCINRDYVFQIMKWCPKYLVEIHGHGTTKTNFDIEISCGEKKNEKFSKDLADKLQKKCSKFGNLSGKSISGEYDQIKLQAKDAVTINNVGWIPFHIELPQQLRIPTNTKVGKPPKEGYLFCDCLIEALNEICRK